MKRFRFTSAVVLGLLAGASLPVWADENADQPPARPAPEEVFKNLDKNDDGKLVADEISEDQQRFFDRLIRVGDNDENGELSRDEFIAALKDRPMPPRDGEGKPRGPRDGDRPQGPKPEQMFERLDQNNDGSISVDEAPERAKPMIEQLLRKSGKEPTASLTRDEFLELVRNFRPDRGPGDGRPREGGPRPEGAPGRGPRPDGERGRGPEGRGPEGFGGPPPMPKFFKVLDTDQDGRLTKDELAQLADKFAALDENEDGQLDMRELMGPPPEGRFAGGQLNRGRGFGPPEGRGPQGRPGGPGGPEGRPGFGPGGPGAAGAPGRGPNPENMLKRFDKNGDGKLSQDEVNENLKKRFDKIDANGDGAIDQDELRTMLEKRANKQGGKKPGKGVKPTKKEAN
ncbi:MAG: EF-hand domain-containing protein [Planctomycetota bacterium]|nr:EF-hand domain-containing protein [Planctomycetota bacterium]MDA1213786.1 EF-hand domain-containing protein [Planctomycetota bacterium]